MKKAIITTITSSICFPPEDTSKKSIRPDC
jgi:hypothetical protein